MGSSESPWAGDPTPTTWDRNGEALHREGRLWAEKGGSGRRREALRREGRLWAKGKLGGVGAGCPGEETTTPGSSGLGSTSRGRTRNFRTDGLQEPIDLTSGSLEAPICPTSQLDCFQQS